MSSLKYILTEGFSAPKNFREDLQKFFIYKNKITEVPRYPGIRKTKSCKKQAEKHGQRVMELAGAYFREQSPEAAGELETLLSATENYADQHCPGYEGILAIHTHVLALRYVNEAYNPSLALAYSRMANLNYTAYLRGLKGRERETALLYQYQVWVICAYAAYDGDDFHGALEWLQRDIDKLTAMPR